MRKISDENMHRLSLTMIFTVITLLFLLTTAAVVGTIIIIMSYYGVFDYASNDISGAGFILNLLGFSCVVGFILTFIVSRYPLKPVNKILNAMNRLASGDYSTRLSFRGPFSRSSISRELTDCFNTMASELDKTEMLRSDFINNFSHEFKTPIVSIAGFARLLRREDLSDDKRREYLSVIEEESMRLSQMATNVLNLSKVENQTILTDVHTYNLTEQLRNCVLMLEGKWAKKHLEPSVTDKEYFVAANEAMMREVWINLIDNAVKFSVEYAPLDIEIESEAETLTIEISNRGEPIPENAVPKIWDKFYQGDESHATKGNGIGLAVVKKVVELHNGEVSAICSGGVTTFTVKLPN